MRNQAIILAMRSNAEHVKACFRRTVDERGDGFLGLATTKQILKNLVPDLTDADFISLLESSGACLVNYSQLIDAMYAAKVEGSMSKSMNGWIDTLESEKQKVQTFAMDSGDTPKSEKQVKSKKQTVDEHVELTIKLGGLEGIAKYNQRSQQIQEDVKRRLPACQHPAWQHDVILRHLGFEGLMEVGQSIQPKFHALVTRMAERFHAVAVIPSRKGHLRSKIKLDVRLGGDVSQLNDIVRATLVFKMHEDVLGDMYNALEGIIEMPELEAAGARVALFLDQYQKPLKDGYGDLLCLISVSGFVCELRLDIDEMLRIRTKGCEAWKVKDELMTSAMKSDCDSLKAFLDASAGLSANCDVYGLTPLHYAAYNGNLDMVNALLSHDADVFDQDKTGRLPLHRAALLGHVDVVETLLTTMESAAQCSMQYKLSGELAATALEQMQDCKSLPPLLVQRVVVWEASQVSKTSSLLHYWARHDRLQAFLAAKNMDLLHVLGEVDKQDEHGSTPLDCAIRHSSSGMAKHLLDAGCHPTQVYIIEECSPKLVEVLKKFAFIRCVVILQKQLLFLRNIKMALQRKVIVE